MHKYRVTYWDYREAGDRFYDVFAPTAEDALCFWRINVRDRETSTDHKPYVSRMCMLVQNTMHGRWEEPLL